MCQDEKPKLITDLRVLIENCKPYSVISKNVKAKFTVNWNKVNSDLFWFRQGQTIVDYFQKLRQNERIKFELRLKFPLVEIGTNKTATLPVLSLPG